MKQGAPRPQENGLRAQTAVAALLRSYGRGIKECSYKSPFDLLVDNHWRVEVKTARSQLKKYGPTWVFNIHRHGKIFEQTDWYILRLEKVPYTKAAIHLLMRAPLERHTVAITMRGLLNRQAEHIRDFYKFAKGEMPPKQEAA